jgi:DNA repair protein RadC
LGLKGILTKPIILQRAGLILVHNHPSGNTCTSEAGIAIIKKIADDGKLFDIALLDHLIIAAGYYSFADNGLV